VVAPFGFRAVPLTALPAGAQTLINAY